MVLKSIKSLKVPIPPLPEQSKIVRRLNEQMKAANKVKAMAEEELNTINAFPAALLLRAFAGEL